MSTGYRKLTGWSALTTVVVVALSVGIAKAEEPAEPIECVTDATANTTTCSYPPPEPPVPTPGVPFGGDCVSPLLAASYELDAPCVPFDACTDSTTLWQLSPCTEGDRIAQCTTIANTHNVLTSWCRDLAPLLDYCLPSNTTKWSVTPCEYQPADIGEPQVIGGVLPKTGSTTTGIATLAAALVLLGMTLRSCARQMDDGVTL